MIYRQNSNFQILWHCRGMAKVAFQFNRPSISRTGMHINRCVPISENYCNNNSKICQQYPEQNSSFLFHLVWSLREIDPLTLSITPNLLDVLNSSCLDRPSLYWAQVGGGWVRGRLPIDHLNGCQILHVAICLKNILNCISIHKAILPCKIQWPYTINYVEGMN